MILFRSVLLASAIAAAAYGGYPFHDERIPFPQELSDHRNALKYHGGKGPYVDRRSYGINRNPPLGCEVDQAIILVRHGERWPSPTDGDFNQMQEAIEKLLEHKGNLNGSLEFVNFWEPFSPINLGFLAEESLYGDYGGLLDAYKLGAETRRRYNHLYDGTSQLPIFAAAVERVVDTARKFGEGFFNWNYTDLAAVNLIQETLNQGANTLTPSCKFKDNRTSSTCEKAPADGFVFPDFVRAAERLNAENPSLNLNTTDIQELISLTGWELNVRGNSPWTNVFTAEEYIAFNYQITSGWYCSVGPASANGIIEGSLYVNATRTLLRQGPQQSLPLVFSFTHDNNIMQVVTALGIDDSDKPWDPTQVSFGQRWDVDDIAPQGGRLVLERLACTSNLNVRSAYDNKFPDAFSEGTLSNGPTKGSTNSTVEYYVRVVFNEAVVPLNGCTNGPGYTCKLEDYEAYVEKRLQNVSYVNECDLPEGSPSELTFYWDYNHTNALNSAPPVLAFQVEDLAWDGVPLNS